MPQFLSDEACDRPYSPTLFKKHIIVLYTLNTIHIAMILVTNISCAALNGL